MISPLCKVIHGLMSLLAPLSYKKMFSYKQILRNLSFTRQDRMLVADGITFRTILKIFQSFEKRGKTDDINILKKGEKIQIYLIRDADPRGIWPASCGLRSALLTDFAKPSTYQDPFQSWNNASKFSKVQLQKKYFWDAKSSSNREKSNIFYHLPSGNMRFSCVDYLLRIRTWFLLGLILIWLCLVHQLVESHIHDKAGILFMCEHTWSHISTCM